MKLVIYIDDEPLVCKAISTVLRGRAMAFTDPLAAIEYIAQHGASVVICDYRMPTMTGLEVRARIASEVPFYLISGELDAPSAPGVTGVLNKPISVETLVEVVERHA